uniref:HIT domain-containing protein n=1 Tax=Chenopodium quinoa TaxID=63459 RepID=A0A803L6M3_CHEQI
MVEEFVAIDANGARLVEEISATVFGVEAGYVGDFGGSAVDQDERVVAFQDINPSAFRHYLVIPIEHIPTVKNLERGQQHYTLVSHMLNVGKSLLQQDAAQSNEHRFGFHQPPFNSVDHLHLHCLALPFIPW